jgi:penicillin-insensitive murein endopeptidase
VTILLATCGISASLALPPIRKPVCEHSASIGKSNHGRLKCGKRMPSFGPHHYLQPFTRAAEYQFGTAELVSGLLWVADRVALPDKGPKMAIGNLSKRGGGDIQLSGSHETGRDVDLPLMMCTVKGRPVESMYHRFDRKGRSEHFKGIYRFDSARNWALLEALLDCPHFKAKFVVLAPWLKTILLDWARNANMTPERIARVDRLLVPPRWARPHDNHFHLRIDCPPDDVPKGCKD